MHQGSAPTEAHPRAHHQRALSRTLFAGLLVVMIGGNFFKGAESLWKQETRELTAKLEIKLMEEEQKFVIDHQDQHLRELEAKYKAMEDELSSTKEKIQEAQKKREEAANLQKTLQEELSSTKQQIKIKEDDVEQVRAVVAADTEERQRRTEVTVTPTSYSSRNPRRPLLPLPELAGSQKAETLECPNGTVAVRDTLLDDPSLAWLENRKIPRIVHVTSRTRCAIPEVAENLDLWRLPGHEFYFHDDDAMDKVLYETDWYEFPQLRNILRCVDFGGAVKADIWRLLVLWEYGGIYTDIDNAPNPAYFNETTLTPDDDAFFVVEQLGHASQWFMVASPRHPMIYLTIQHVLRNINSLKNVADFPVVFTTGPGAVQNGFMSFMYGKHHPNAPNMTWDKPGAGFYQGVANRTVRIVGSHLDQNQWVIRDVWLQKGKGYKLKQKMYEQMGMTHLTKMNSRDTSKPNKQSCWMRLLEHIDETENDGLFQRQLPSTANAISYNNVPSPEVTVAFPPIPRRLAFNFKDVDLLNDPMEKIKGAQNKETARNVRRTVGMFKSAWKQDDVEAVFLTDSDCESIIQQVEPRLIPHFKTERGAHKSDLCRVADLYFHGGYYLDNDVGLLKIPHIASHIRFATMFDDLGHTVQAFIAASPKHPVLLKALQVSLDFYEGRLDPKRDLGHSAINVGTWTLKQAYNLLAVETPAIADTTKFFHQYNLEDYPKHFPEINRDKHWRHYNHALIDIERHEMFAWMRMGVDFRKSHNITA